MKQNERTGVRPQGMTGLSQELVQECRRKLLDAKQLLMNRIRSTHSEFQQLNHLAGDEADQSVSILAENQYLSAQERARQQLLEIELALKRISEGTYGICEECEEPIEVERLLALPWTRLSIEGAEIRESNDRRYARS